MHPPDRLITATRLTLRVLSAANRIFLLALGLALLASWLFAPQCRSFIASSNPGTDAASELSGLRLEVLLGVAMAIATDQLLANLIHIVTSAANGDPFIGTNAGRLRKIGWSLLALQLLVLPAALIARFYPSLASPSPLGEFSPGGWVAVLAVFVLARVFAHGATLRDELAGTI